MDRRVLVLGLAATALAPQAAHAAGKPPVKLAKVFGYLDKYLAIPPAQRNRFVLAYYVLMNGKPAAGLKAAIVEPDGRRTPLTLGPDGKVLRLPTAAQLASADFVAEVPAETKLGVRLELEPSMALASDYNPPDLDQAIAQANAGMSKAAGLMSFALPKLTGVTFAGAASGKARLADGREMVLPLAEGAPFYDPSRLKGAVAVALARAPTRLAFKDK
jgi:hypothetical protein